MPWDMTVKGPYPWVVQRVLENNVPIKWHHHRVPADRVVGLQRLAVPIAVTCGEQLDVVAMQVHGVHILDDKWIVDHDAYGSIGAEIVHPAFLPEGLPCTSCLGVAENRIAIVALVEVATELHHVFELCVHREAIFKLLVDREEGKELYLCIRLFKRHGIIRLGDLQIILQ